jgi:hypothetical protein
MCRHRWIGQALLHASGLPQVMRLHREFVRAQMRSLAEQGRRNRAIGHIGRDRNDKAEKLKLINFLIEVSGLERASAPGLPCGIAP